MRPHNIYSPSQKIPNEDLLPYIELQAQGLGMREIAEKLGGISPATVCRRLQLAAQRGLMGFQPVLPGFAITKTTEVTNEDGDVVREFVQQKPEHGEEFQVPNGHMVSGVSALVDAQGNVINQWIKTCQEKEHTIAMMQAALEAYKAELPRAEPVPAPRMTEPLLLNQYTITDHHMGMLCWGEETGGGDYDLKIAEKLIIDWFNTAISCSPHAHTAVFAQLGDFMHHDGFDSVTPANRNVLDADSRLQKIIRTVIRVVRQITALLLERHQHVHFIWADANHDPASAAWMRELLFAFFEDEPRISVDRSADKYYAYEWGQVALFYHHGHRRKIDSVDSVFAGKFREMYGRAKHSYGHIGHHHNDAVRESNLMRIERHRTLAAPDAYAGSGGWLAKRDAKVITYHKSFGEVARFTLCPEMITNA